MTRWRFWLTQMTWLVLSLGVMGAYAVGDSQPPSEGAAVVFMGFLFTGFILRWGADPEQRNNQQPSTLVRAGATMFLWFTYLAAVFIGLAEVGAIAILLAFILMFPLLLMSLLIWGVLETAERRRAMRMNTGENTAEKRKRDRIDQVLRDLSDDDLVRLRDRLSDGTINEDNLRYMLTDDGEILVDER